MKRGNEFLFRLHSVQNVPEEAAFNLYWVGQDLVGTGLHKLQLAPEGAVASKQGSSANAAFSKP